MFTSTGRIICKTCGGETRIVTVDHQSLSLTTLHLECRQCGEQRAVVLGRPECQELANLAA